jgi:hypothetical protein
MGISCSVTPDSLRFDDTQGQQGALHGKTEKVGG